MTVACHHHLGPSCAWRGCVCLGCHVIMTTCAVMIEVSGGKGLRRRGSWPKPRGNQCESAPVSSRCNHRPNVSQPILTAKLTTSWRQGTTTPRPLLKQRSITQHTRPAPYSPTTTHTHTHTEKHPTSHDRDKSRTTTNPHPFHQPDQTPVSQLPPQHPGASPVPFPLSLRDVQR